jgi:membrane associated rhomboid family serine protease
MLPVKDNVPTDRAPVATLALIAVLVGVFVYQLTLSDAPGSAGGPPAVSERAEFAISHGAIPARLLDPGSACEIREATQGGQGAVICGAPVDEVRAVTAPWPVSLLTSILLSAGLLALVLNAGFLWLLGNTLEASIGRARFLALYVVGALAGLYLQASVEPDSTAALAGAAGGVAAVLGGYLVLHPRGRVLMISVVPLFAGLYEVPATPLVAGWLLLSVLPLVSAIDPTGLAGGSTGPYLMGVGGLLLGLAIIRLLAPADRGIAAPLDGG